MRRLEFVEKGTLRWVDAPDPMIEEPTDALVRPVASTTCDLDRAIIAGQTPFAGPFAIGHECVAEVIETGEDSSELEPGDLVVVPWHVACGRCGRCLAGRPSQCSETPRYAMYGVPLGGDWGGLFDELVRVPWAEDALTRVPDGVDPELLASASDNLTDAWRAARSALGGDGGEILVVGGTASIGIYAAAAALALGAERVDYVDRDPGRRALAEAAGASVHERVPDGAEYDGAIDASANRKLLATALSRVRGGGHCHSVGIYFGDDTPMPLATMYMNGVSFSTGRPDVGPSIPDAVEAVRAGEIDPGPVFSERIPAADAAEALAELPRKPLVVRERLHG